MTRVLLIALAFSLVSLTAAEDSPYQVELMRLRARQATLETMHVKAGKGVPKLTQEEEKERLQLAGQLAEMDPIGVLLLQLETDIHALLDQQPADPNNAQLLDQLKDFMAFTAGMQGYTKTLAEANKHASQLRGFIVRRDMAGMKKYTNSFR